MGRVSKRQWLGQDRRLGGLPLADVSLAAVLFVVSVGGAILQVPDLGPRWLTVPVSAVMAAATAWRRQSPFASFVVVVGAGLLQTLLAEDPGTTYQALIVYVVMTYSVAAHTSEGLAAIGLALIVGASWLEEWLDHGEDYLFLVLMFGGTWVLGRLVQQSRTRATVAELNQDEGARLAVADERARIARELHDIVAHGVSVIAIQADAARAVLRVDPDQAVEPLTVISDSARDVLDELRRLLVVLRIGEATDTSVTPLPGLDQLSDLARGMTAAGLPVELTVECAGVRPPAIVELSAYRIVQESLTNVLRHAGAARTVVTVRCDAAGVVVEVTNERGSPSAIGAGGSVGAGHGLIGIRERTALVGGVLDAGPTRDGGFRVSANLPAHRHVSVVAP